MSKPRSKLTFRLPSYVTPRNTWREAIHESALREARAAGIEYGQDTPLEVEVLLYLDASELRFHDVDNRLKDVLDALQGRAGGPKDERSLEPIIPNDSQVHRVVVEKRIAPPQSHGQGRVTIRAFRRADQRRSN